MIERFHLLLSVARSSSDALGATVNLAQLFGVSTIWRQYFLPGSSAASSRNRHNVIALSCSQGKLAG